MRARTSRVGGSLEVLNDAHVTPRGAHCEL